MNKIRLPALTLVWILLQLAFISATLNADEPDDTISYILETVIVYGERSRPPSSLIEIDARVLQSLNAVSVADALRSSLGMTVSSGAKSETETRIRGFAASNVLVLVDGRPINPGYYGKVDLSMIPLDNVSKITVVKGPSELAYGANTMGGVINITMKNGTDSPGTSVSGEFGSNLYRNITINHGREFGQYSLWLCAYEIHSSGFSVSDYFESTSLEDGNVRDHSGYHKLGVDGKIGFVPSPSYRGAISFGYHWARKDIASTIYAWDSPSNREFPDWRRYHISANGIWKPKPGLSIKTSAFSDGYSDRLVDYRSSTRSEESLEYDSRLRNWTQGIDIDVTASVRPEHTLSSTLQVKLDRMKKQPDLDQDWLARRTYTGSMSLQWGWQVSSHTNVTMGVGVYLLRPQNAEMNSSFISRMLALHYKLPLAIQSTVSYARALRFPTIHELYGESSGNENLKPQFADKYEIGAERWFTVDRGRSYLKTDIAIFYNDLSDMIYREARSYRYRNIGSANSYGWEFEAQCDLRNQYRARCGFARLQSSESTFEVMASNPRNAFHLQLSATVGRVIELGYEFSRVGERTTRMRDVTLTMYSLHNANLSYKLTKAIVVRLDVNNISDMDYQEELGYPAPGRQVVVGVSSRLGI